MWFFLYFVIDGCSLDDWIATSDLNLCKTLLGENGCLGNPYFTYWLPKHPVFLFTLALTQSVRLPMVTYASLCSPCVTYGTLCHATGHQVLPTLATALLPIPRGAEDFPRGANHSKHVPLSTYLAWLQPIYYNSRFVFILVKTARILLVVKTLIKKHRAATKLISSHENIEQQPH